MSLRVPNLALASLAFLVGSLVPLSVPLYEGTAWAQAAGGAGGTVTFGGSAAGSGGGDATAPAAPAPAAPAAGAPAAGAEGAAEAAPGEAGAEQAGEEDEWTVRDRQINESNTLTGGTGLLRTQHAQTGEPGQFRLQFVNEWYQASYLCTSSQSCPNPGGSGRIINDTMNHIGGTLSLGTSLFKIGAGTFDAYGAIMAFANSDAANKPSLLQVLGDTDIGIRYTAPLGSVVHLGLFTELWLINGTGSVGLDGSGTSAKFGGIGTIDLRGLESKVPLRFSLNAVYFLDNTSDVLGPTEQARGAPVTRIERYGLGVNRVDQFQLFIGAEALLADERVRPFLEEKIGFATNRQGYPCKVNNPSQDLCLANQQTIPSTLTIGGRFLPWKRGFNLLAAVDIGTSGTNNFIEELSPVPPWTLYLGAGWAVDTKDRPPVVQTKLVEKPVEKAPSHGHVTGFVHETNKTDPIVGAIATYRDHPDLSPLASGADGKFADDVAPGKYTYDIKADGYKPGSCDAVVPPEGGAVGTDCALDALPRVGIVDGHVRDAETSQPISGISVELKDSGGKTNRLNTDASGGFKFDGVTPGSASLSVQADGYLVMVTPTDVKARQEDTVDLMLRPKPKQGLITLTANEIQIKQQVQFALDSAVILPESFGLLTEIADTIIRNPQIKRIEVQGHTDNSGTAEHNKVLSEQRAEAVRAWLVQHGTPADRLVARGYGQEKPLVPNVTAGNRSRNRRVQFIILEKDGGPPAGPAAPAPGPAPAPKKLPGF